MDNSENILVSKDVIEKLNVKLKSVKLMISDPETKDMVDEIINLLNEEYKKNQLTFRELIQEKIRETKYSNEELNFKLYMLYRKLEEGKISEEEAVKSYDIYVSGGFEK